MTATLIHVRTKDQTADIFTKSLTGQDFVVRRERILGDSSRYFDLLAI